MNIFLFDKSSHEANAKAYPDKLICKMPLESLQLLASACYANELSPPNTKHGNAYKLTHAKHPCAIWASRNASNYAWLCDLAQALCDEFTNRYATRHSCEISLQQARLQIAFMPPGELEHLPFCLSDECKAYALSLHTLPEEATLDWRFRQLEAGYRLYLQSTKLSYASWRYCDSPSWWLLEGQQAYDLASFAMKSCKLPAKLIAPQPSFAMPELPQPKERKKKASKASPKAVIVSNDTKLEIGDVCRQACVADFLPYVADLQSLRCEISKALNGKNVPTKASLLKWQAESEMQSESQAWLADRACGHVIFWRNKRLK